MTDVQQPPLLQTNGENVSENGNDEANANGSHSSRGARRTKEPLTSKQQLNSTIKSVRDLLRKDSGLSGDTDRLPQLT
jgi:hypothetical protein